jgi:hypothetical protein
MADLAGGPDPLGDRTWSSDPAMVTATAGAFAEGMCAAGVYPTFKHFPGHGHSDVDADLEPATTPDLATLEAADLLPFRDLTKSMKGRSLVMTGHLDVPGLTTEGRPLSLDPGAMAYLRDQMGFDGVAVTDELAEMGSITQRDIPVAEAVEQSLDCGQRHGAVLRRPQRPLKDSRPAGTGGRERPTLHRTCRRGARSGHHPEGGGHMPRPGPVGLREWSPCCIAEVGCLCAS